jgi:cytosine deaminase
MEWCFDAVTVNSAAIMGLDGYGLNKGDKANMVVLQAADRIEAIRLRAHRLEVIRAGRVIARADPVVTKLDLPGRPGTLNAADFAP